MSKANTYIQRAADFLRTIDNDSDTQADLRKKQELRWHDLRCFVDMKPIDVGQVQLKIVRRRRLLPPHSKGLSEN